QMRLGDHFEISVNMLRAVLFLGVLGTAIHLWVEGKAGLGVVAATTAMIMKLNSMAFFIMWQISALFENIGTIQDGMGTLSRPVEIQDKKDAKPLKVTAGEIRFD
ncbi:MAG TPA: multidrug ABC transporter ATP-binding protein, partial [Acinetobacter radioresistens]|nr:multidrug ABC transporter ATP-binding protein [Acinetobacter radioresistens]